MSTEVEIGIWVDGTQKWVNGVTRRTSCYDVIKALLRAQNLPSEDNEITNYVIVERWRKMERPLDHEQRILKVWKTWGESIEEVRFALRKSRGDDTRDCDTPSRIERRRRHKHRQTIYTTQMKKQPKEDDKIEETMDRLMKLVLAQGETIQTQLKKLQERDTQIDTYEQQMHLLRVQSLGSDYLVHSYLKDPPREPANDSKDDMCEQKSNDSGVVADETMDTSEPSKTEKENFSEIEELQAKTTVMEEMEKILIQMVMHEENLLNLETLIAENQKIELEQLQEELLIVTRSHSQTVSQARQNEQNLREYDTVLLKKKKHFEKLLEEDRRLDQETIKLQNQLDYIMHLPPSAFRMPQTEPVIMNDKSTQFTSTKPPVEVPPPLPATSPPPLDDEEDSARTSSCSSSPSRSTPEKSVDFSTPSTSNAKDSDNVDSNSDTGLSSLHSSSDEGVYILNTLV